MNSDPGEIALPPLPRAWWRCPGAVVAFHAQRTFFGVAAAWPLSRWIGARMSGRAGGDATLFDDGGVLFAEALRQVAPFVRPLFSGSLVVALIAFLAGHVAMAAVVDAIARPEPSSLRARLGDALGPVPVLVLLSIASLVLGGAVFGLVWWSGRSVASSLFTGPAARDLSVLGVALCGLAAASWVGVLRDLVVAAVVGRRLGFAGALDLAWKTLRGRAFGLWVQHAIRSTGAAVAIAAALLAAIRIGMRSRGDATTAQLVLEAALVAATCLRVSWLGVVCVAVHDRASERESLLPPAAEPETSSPSPT